MIAYGVGGAKDYVVDGKNGVLFEPQTVEALKRVIREFDKMKFDRKKVAESADKFAVGRFDKELKEYVKKCKGTDGQK